MDTFQRKILTALVAAGGEITLDELHALYDAKGSGYRVAGMNRRQLTEWVRPEDRAWGGAIGLRITDSGRASLATGRRDV